VGYGFSLTRRHGWLVKNHKKSLAITGIWEQVSFSM